MTRSPDKAPWNLLLGMSHWFYFKTQFHASFYKLLNITRNRWRWRWSTHIFLKNELAATRICMFTSNILVVVTNIFWPNCCKIPFVKHVENWILYTCFMRTLTANHFFIVGYVSHYDERERSLIWIVSLSNVVSSEWFWFESLPLHTLCIDECFNLIDNACVLVRPQYCRQKWCDVIHGIKNTRQFQFKNFNQKFWRFQSELVAQNFVFSIQINPWTERYVFKLSLLSSISLSCHCGDACQSSAGCRFKRFELLVVLNKQLVPDNCCSCCRHRVKHRRHMVKHRSMVDSLLNRSVVHCSRWKLMGLPMVLLQLEPSTMTMESTRNQALRRRRSKRGQVQPLGNRIFC